MQPFRPEDNVAGALLEESSFSTLFPTYREKYMKEIWPDLEKYLMDKHGVKAELDLLRGTMTVRTTRRTWDPTAILSARNMLWMLSRSMPLEKAVRCFEDGVDCDIIKIKGLASKKDTFVKRRQRLLGHHGATLKVLELLTNTTIIIQGNTVAVLGTSKGVNTVRTVVTDCIAANIHPVRHIKQLMIRRELEKVPELANESWARFMPQYKKKNAKTTKPRKAKVKKSETRVYDVEFTERKEDKAMASGEYFTKEARDARERRRKARMAQAASRGQGAEDGPQAGGHGKEDSDSIASSEV